MADHIFVYGTLHPQRAPAEIAQVVRRFRKVGPGTVRGRVLDLGEYPGIILASNSKHHVAGTVFRLPEDPVALSKLDKYEEYDPQNPESSLFKRRKAKVTLSDGSTSQCWIYVYNKPFPSQAIAKAA